MSCIQTLAFSNAKSDLLKTTATAEKSVVEFSRYGTIGYTLL